MTRRALAALVGFAVAAGLAPCRPADACHRIKKPAPVPSDPPATSTPVNVVKLLLTKPLPTIIRLKRDPVAGPALAGVLITQAGLNAEPSNAIARRANAARP